MNLLVTQILAVGLTLSQLFNKPIEQFRPAFNPETDQAQVEQLLTQGCTFMVKEFSAEKIDFGDLFSMMINNYKAAQERDAATAGDPNKASESASSPAPGSKLSVSSFLDRIDIPTVYAAYKQYCKGEKVENSPVKLSEVIEYYNKALANLPDPRKLKNFKLPESSLVLDREGKRFTEIYTDNNRRKWVSIDDMPDYLQKAFVAAEDKRFFKHKGLDMRGIIRAFATGLASKARPQGGSTITQQVVKNLLTGDDLTFERKMREMVLAVRLEKTLTKKEILELYLNFVFLGRSSWGVEMASESYFGKGVKQLTLSEAAILAALTRGPNYYHADLHTDRLEERRMYVLSRMKEDGYLPADTDMAKLSEENTNLIAFESPRARAAFYFLDEIQRDARAKAGIASLTSGSYVVRSTIQPELQKVTEKALQDGLADYEAQAGRTPPLEPEGSIAEEIEKYKSTWQEVLPKHHGMLWDVQWPLATVIDDGSALVRTKSGRQVRSGVIKVGLADGRIATLINVSQKNKNLLKVYDLIRVQVSEGKKLTATLRVAPLVQGAIVVLEAKTGRVLAMSGGFSYAKSQLNRATRTTRQVGSTLKPFIYLAALNLGFQPNTLIPNVPISLEPIDRGGHWYSPHNYDRGSGGLVTIRQAVEQSLNLPTVRITSELGHSPTEGLDYIRGVTQELGIYEKPVRFYPFVLGAQPTRLIDMAVAYATIANIGMKPTPYFIDSIEQNGKVIFERPRFNLQPIPSIDRVSFYQTRHILEGTVARGTATRLKDLTGYVAGKTGTTNNGNDAWFIGFTNDLVVATWVGYDSTKVKSSLGGKFTGGKVALPIAEKVIRASFNIYKDKEPLVGMPSDVAAKTVVVPIDVWSGRFNAGDYPEVFRMERPGVPKNTVSSLLKGNETTMSYSQQPRGDEDEDIDDGQDEFGNTFQAPMAAQRPPDAYQPGAEDNYDLWNRRNRRIDNFFANPFYR